MVGSWLVVSFLESNGLICTYAHILEDSALEARVTAGEARTRGAAKVEQGNQIRRSDKSAFPAPGILESWNPGILASWLVF